VGEPAPPILSNQPGSFAWGVFHERHPILIQQLRETVPYPSEIVRALDALLAETLDGVIAPLGRGARDQAAWDGWGRDHIGRRWADVPFLWGESYFYRRLLAAVRYFEPGPWFAVDPFEPLKAAELVGEALAGELVALDRVLGLPAAERLAPLLHASLWGNQADLGFLMAAAGGDASGLVADDTPLLRRLLTDGPAGQVCLVADNAAGELVADLVLIDHLLTGGLATAVALHVKPAPYYVSDATTIDVLAGLRRLRQGSERVAGAAHRLRQAMTGGRLSIRTHPFYCAPLPFQHMPAEVADQFHAASLTILKGDLNYRRLVDDRHWAATTPIAEVTSYFPGAFAALRTLKSDVVVGLGPQVQAVLDETAEAWRTSGAYALIQVRA
jgi:hypothetical protein